MICQEEELKRAIERAELAETKLKGIEEELQAVGEFNLYHITFYHQIRTSRNKTKGNRGGTTSCRCV